LKILEKEKSKN